MVCSLCGEIIEKGKPSKELAISINNILFLHGNCYEEINKIIEDLKELSNLEPPDLLPDTNS
jgi:hypothetical protein